MKFPAMVFALLVLLSGTVAAETLYLKGILTAGEHPLLNDLLIRPSSRLSAKMLPREIDTLNSICYLSQKSIASLLDNDLKDSLVGEGIWIFPSSCIDSSEEGAATGQWYSIITSEILDYADSFSIPLYDWNQLHSVIKEGAEIVQASLLPNGTLRLSMSEKNEISDMPSTINLTVSTNIINGDTADIVVRAGTPVNVLIYRQGIFISARGMVNSSAGVGEITRIRLNGTSRIIDARITGPDSAEALFQ